jgi:hypothetical protein
VARVFADEEKVVELGIRNSLSSQFQVDSIVTSCGCAVAKPSARAVNPGDVLKVSIHLAPFRSDSVFEKTVTVHFLRRNSKLRGVGVDSKSFVIRVSGESKHRLLFPQSACMADVQMPAPWRFNCVKADTLNWQSLRVACPGFPGEVYIRPIDHALHAIEFNPSSASSLTLLRGRAMPFACYAQTAEKGEIKIGESYFVLRDTRVIKLIPDHAPGTTSNGTSRVQLRLLLAAGAPGLHEDRYLTVVDEALQLQIKCKPVRIHDRIWAMTIDYGRVVEGVRRLSIIDPLQLSMRAEGTVVFPTLNEKKK